MRHVALMAALTVTAGCTRQFVDMAGLRCNEGNCLKEWDCHPERDLCVPTIHYACDGSGVCASTTQTGDECESEGSYLPCVDGVTDCTYGCRTCEDGQWSDCSEGACQHNGAEVCDGTDNDCNGEIDDIEPTALQADCNDQAEVANPQVAIWACDNGCSITACAPGYYDIENGAQDGCEYVCSGHTEDLEVCDGDDDDCDGTTDNVLDIDTDCSGQVTNPQHVTSWGCISDECAIVQCETAWTNGNASADDGCETPCVDTGPEVCDDANTDEDCDGFADPPDAIGC